MRFAMALLFSVAAISGVSSPHTWKAVKIYAVDVEGGKATLVISPSGESLLIDTGNIGGGALRDAERIMAAVNDAGLQRIDHLMTTHWHRDHVGAMALLAARIPILEFIDHGPNVQPDPQVDAFLQETYPALYAKSKRTIVRPGDRISISGLEVRVVAAGGKTIRAALPGAGAPNPYCAGFKHQITDHNENTHSIGVSIDFGRFRLLDLGDLTATKEFELMCPQNPIGTVDLFMVSHHGQPNSNLAVLVHAIAARVAVMDNGTLKGGEPEVMEVIHSSPGLEDLWQLHASQLSGQEYTVPGLFIANHADKADLTMSVAPMSPLRNGETTSPPSVHNGTAYWIKISARQDGSFAVTNARNGFSKTYRARYP